MLIKGIAAASLLAAVIVYLTVQSVAWTVGAFCIAFLVLAAIALAFLWIACKKVDMEVPQEEDSPFYRAMMYIYIEALVMLVGARIVTKGLEKTRSEGAHV